ncbi:hypothetical protein LRS06_05215 [Hymenobacter sp. J193]|uniref:hypothetical protein n=1 Tax=Hymenobacter sp. J193 TaxID=2898429 RepID=UPI002151AFEC|nr:hypothetical protein [Hymenobacter sp. J193]MCR5887187.1 hypothetical protein [Hymenobacter sp. J193]
MNDSTSRGTTQATNDGTFSLRAYFLLSCAWADSPKAEVNNMTRAKIQLIFFMTNCC